MVEVWRATLETLESTENYGHSLPVRLCLDRRDTLSEEEHASGEEDQVGEHIEHQYGSLEGAQEEEHRTWWSW